MEEYACSIDCLFHCLFELYRLTFVVCKTPVIEMGMSSYCLCCCFNVIVKFWFRLTFYHDGLSDDRLAYQCYMEYVRCMPFCLSSAIDCRECGDCRDYRSCTSSLLKCSSSSSAFPSYISGVHHFWVRFLHMWPFFYPSIKVVTFRLRGWCVLGVFLLPAFTRLGHEHQDLLSPCNEMHVCTD